MEIPRPSDGSADVFSFPGNPVKDSADSEFEFGSVTPDSPSSDMSKNSPADHLFFNGRLLPHYFPCQTPNSLLNGNSRLTPSRTSSVSSKESYSSSLMSSRSNSVNSSRSSSCSSGRTSYSGDSSERRLLYQNRIAAMRTRSTREGYSNKGHCNKDVVSQLYGSQRWQFITPMPTLSRETSSRRKKADEMIIKEETGNNKPKKEKTGSQHRGFCRKFFDSFMSTCRQCHAMEAQVKDETIVCECS